MLLDAVESFLSTASRLGRVGVRKFDDTGGTTRDVWTQ